MLPRKAASVRQCCKGELHSPGRSRTGIESVGNACPAGMDEPESSIRNKDQSINFDFLFLSASSVVSPNGETTEEAENQKVLGQMHKMG